MELRWTEEAVTDLERIADYLFEKTPHTRLSWRAQSTTLQSFC